MCPWSVACSLPVATSHSLIVWSKLPEAILVGQGLPAPRGARAWTVLGLQGIAQHAKPLAECGPEELWRGLLDLTLTDYRQVRQLLDQAEKRLDELGKANDAVQLLETTPGLGPRTAEAIVAHLHQPERFATGKQLSAYGGLVPRQYQSGDTDRRGRITRRAARHHDVRQALYPGEQRRPRRLGSDSLVTGKISCSAADLGLACVGPTHRGLFRRSECETAVLWRPSAVAGVATVFERCHPVADKGVWHINVPPPAAVRRGGCCFPPIGGGRCRRRSNVRASGMFGHSRRR